MRALVPLPKFKLTPELFQQISSKMESYNNLKMDKHRIINREIIGLTFLPPEACGTDCDCHPFGVIPLLSSNEFIQAKMIRAVRQAVLEGIDSELLIVINELTQLGMIDLNNEPIEPTSEDEEDDE